MPHRRSREFTQRGRGFSLMEVLISMAIFAIGFASVASVFPVAILLQKQATEAAEIQILERSIQAYLQARPFLASDLNNTGAGAIPADTRVHPPLHNESIRNALPIEERSFPSTAGWNVRKYYWVPLVRRMEESGNTPADEWQAFVFILKKDEGKDFEYGDSSSNTDWANFPDSGLVPGVKKIPNAEMPSLSAPTDTRFAFDNRLWEGTTPAGEADQIRAGDQVLDSNGVIYTVLAADAGGIEVKGKIVRVPHDPNGSEFSSTPFNLWYSKPPDKGKASPVRKVIVVNHAVR